jgi:hypothetical protein
MDEARTSPCEDSYEHQTAAQDRERDTVLEPREWQATMRQLERAYAGSKRSPTAKGKLTQARHEVARYSQSCPGGRCAADGGDSLRGRVMRLAMVEGQCRPG